MRRPILAVLLCTLACGQLPGQGSTTAAVSGGGIENGGFETGDLSSWHASGTARVTGDAHSGRFAVQVGSDMQLDGDSMVTQSFLVPAGQSVLSFWYRAHCRWQTAFTLVVLSDPSGNGWQVQHGGSAGACDADTGWVHQSWDLSANAGHQVTLTLQNDDFSEAGVVNQEATYLEVDDVELTQGAATAGIVNGDFESGKLDPWYTVGAVSITHDSLHGVYAMQVGESGRSTTGTGAAQEFFAPAGHSRVVFSSRPRCRSKTASCTIQVMAASGEEAPVWAMSCGGRYGPCANDGSWTQATTRDLAGVAGKKMAFRVSIDDESDASAESTVDVDDVQLVTDAVNPSLANGDFEGESLDGWSATGYVWTVGEGHSGSWSAALGTIAGDHALTQAFVVPQGHPVLSFWYLMHCANQNEFFTATIGDAIALAPTCAAAPQWTQATFDLSRWAGQEVSLQLLEHNVSHDGAQSWTEVDDVAVGDAPPPSLANGGFESGNLSGWTATGSAKAMSDLPHGGDWSVMLGDFAPTGDSTLSQTFTVPAAGGTLSFWYDLRCPDSVQYDWATATVTDAATGQVTTILPRTCGNAGHYEQVSADLSASAGHQVTLMLVNHDDGWVGDATFTYFDDVTVN